MELEEEDHSSLNKQALSGHSVGGDLLAYNGTNGTNKQPQLASLNDSSLSATRQSQLARSRSRGRNPSELLARKQQLVSDQLEASGSWSTASPQSSSSNNNNNNNNNNDQQEQHRRSQVRRAKQLEMNRINTNEDSITIKSKGDNNNVSPIRSKEIEAKLESLSELLKSHQKERSSFIELKENVGSELNDNNTDDNNYPNKSMKTSPSTTTATSIENVYIILAKKEKDLQLAAELGKVLLEKNDELSKTNERITEDYSHKLELLEQEKHKLKRKLDLLDGEYENRLVELQTDCNILKNQLDEQQQLAKKKEKETSKLIDDLVQQNQRLTSELVEATKSEELLSSQLEQMNERFNVRLSNRQDHVAQLEGLKEEIQIVNQRKQDLERRLKLANNDKSNLNALLEETSDKILLLENLLNEKDGKLNELLDEINELRDSSSWLSSELELMINMNEKLSTNSNLNNNDSNKDTASKTTFSLDLAACQRKRSQLIERLKQLRLRNQSRLKASEFIMLNKANKKQSISNSFTRGTRLKNRNYDNERQGDESLFAEMNNMDMIKGDRRGPAFSDFGGSSPQTHDGDDDEEEEFDSDGENFDDSHDDFDDIGERSKRRRKRVEISSELLIEIFIQLQNFYKTLCLRKERFQNNNNNSSSKSTLTNTLTINNHTSHLYSPNSTDDSGISGDDIDNKLTQNGLNSVAIDTSNNKTNSFQANNANSWRQLLELLKALIEELPCSSCHLMIAERNDYEQLQKTYTKLCDDLKRKDDELLELKAFKLEQETKLSALEERCKILQDDLENCDTKPKEEIVKLAWKARDDAVQRKNNAEISLAKTRIENMQISSQLMEVVQQKGELSQKLAQFEDDIHYITQDSVKAKFTWEEYAEKLRRNAGQQSNTTTSSSSNPLAQLLNFSYSNVVASTTTGSPTRATSAKAATFFERSNNNNNNNSNKAVTPQIKSGKTNSDNIGGGNQSASNLMRNFTTNKFNLKFWQRNSPERDGGESNDNDKRLQTTTKIETETKTKTADEPLNNKSDTKGVGIVQVNNDLTTAKASS